MDDLVEVRGMLLILWAVLESESKEFSGKKENRYNNPSFTPVLRTSIKQGHFTQLSDAPFPCPLERLRAPLGAIIKLSLELHRSVHTMQRTYSTRTLIVV